MDSSTVAASIPGDFVHSSDHTAVNNIVAHVQTDVQLTVVVLAADVPDDSRSDLRIPFSGYWLFFRTMTRTWIGTPSAYENRIVCGFPDMSNTSTLSVPYDSMPAAFVSSMV